MSWKPEVKTAGDSTWAGNALRFATEDEALTYVADLMMRWTAVTETRVIEVDDMVNATCLREEVNGETVRVLKHLPEPTVVGPYSPLPREDGEDGPVVILPTE